jgi:hypothetical protein
MNPCAEQDKRFQYLNNPLLREKMVWLKSLCSSVRTIADFGCWRGEEPLALCWTLDPTEVVVVEIKQEHVAALQKNVDAFAQRGLLGSCVITVLLADMACVDLPGQHFDLAYCQEVLYDVYLQSERKLRSAIDKMIEVVRPGGYVVAVEEKIGTNGSGLTGPMDMDPWFQSSKVAPLHRLACPCAPKWSYCYQRVSL